MSPAEHPATSLPAPLPRGRCLAYAAGDLGPALTSLCLAFYWLYFLIHEAGVPALHAGLIHGSGYVVSAAANLWAGHVIERHVRTPAGRTRLIALLGAAMGACFVLLWTRPGLGHWDTAWYLALSWLFHLLFALVYLAYLSLTPLLAHDARSRIDLNSWRFGGTMLVTLVVLGLHTAWSEIGAMAHRLLLLGAVVGLLGALGSVACGIGLRRALAATRLERGGAPASWRMLARSAVLWRAAGVNLAVWCTVQSASVLTIFLCHWAAVPDARILLLMQCCLIAAAVGTSLASRRWQSETILVAAAVLWCGGALCWWNAMAPVAAAILLGLGLGAATVTSWAGVPEAIERFAAATGRHADAGVYAALTVLRDLVSALVPLLATAAMGAGAADGAATGPAAAGRAAAAVLLATGLCMAAAVALLTAWRRAPVLPADAGTAGTPKQ